MKTKPILIGVAAIVLLAGIFLFIRHRGGIKPEKAEISQFLYSFNFRVTLGNTDTILSYFASNKRTKAVKRLVNLLAGKTSSSGEKPLGKVALDIDNATIKIVSTQLAIATVPVKFTHDSLESRQSSMVIKIYKLGIHKFKIVQVDAKQFYEDYGSYENFVRSKTVNEKDLFSEITLAAFKTANQLKAKYDSVVWFDHVDNRTYYYVIKGKIGQNFYWPWSSKERDGEKSIYKMGLVSPDLKEIIPTEFDLIHNVGGTIDGLIEVEKDNKKGFYNTDGKNVVPAKYDQIFPLSDDANIALLREGQNYFYLKSDFTITDKVDDLKITDVLTKIKIYGNTFTLSDKNSKNILEANSRDSFISLIIAPSYLVDFQILPMFVELQNPLRHMSNSDGEEGDGEGSLSYKINYDGTTKKDESWFETIYYSVVDDYLGARAGLDEIKNVLVVDKKQNKIYSYSAKSYFGGAEGGGALCGKCNENSFRSIGDTLFEFKTTSALDQQTMNLDEGPYYHYLHIVNGQLVPLPNERIFGFTKYIKMDDSYLNGCYVIGNIRTESATIDMLKYMKNEIYASYGYKFKNETWNDTFSGRFNRYDKAINTNVDDSLTAIDKYNIAWINSKLNKKKPNTLAAK